MDNYRLLIWASFALVFFMNYQAWMTDYGVSPNKQINNTESHVNQSTDVPLLPEDNIRSQNYSEPSLDVDIEPIVSEQDSENIIYVKTDVLSVEINTKGGTIQKAILLNYPIAKDQPDVLVELLSTDLNNTGLIQTGINSPGNSKKANHNAVYISDNYNYELFGEEDLRVNMTWSDGLGIKVDKTFIFKKGSYQVDVLHNVINDSNLTWSGAEYAQMIRRLNRKERSMFDVDTYSFDGPMIYDGSRSEKLKEDDLESDPVNIRSTNGWLAVVEHHFLRAIIPALPQEYVYDVSIRGDVSVASVIKGSLVTVEPGYEHEFETIIFIGPKLQNQLEKITEKLKLTVDYGWLTVLSQPLFWLLSFAYSLFGNWGGAIIVVTILIKLVFYKLTESSGRSMAKMREIQPRMKALQDRYKDDKQALSQAMMDLYKREKVNPAAGCLPILIQMPFFLAFYWVLLESVEMRQAPFFLWIADLSSRDPFFILPIIMGGAMLFQQKLNPTPADPVQAKVMQIMPIMFTGMFAFFPSGLVLYWVTNTVLSIAQQWYINKIVHEEAKNRSGKNKTK